MNEAQRRRSRLSTLLLGLLICGLGAILLIRPTTSDATRLETDRTRAATSGYVATPTVASGDVAPGVKIVASGPLYIPAELANADSANAPLIWYSEQTGRCFDFWARATEQGEPYDVTVRLVDCRTGRPP